MNEDQRKALTGLVKTSYFLGLASGSGQEVFNDGRIYTFAELQEEYKQRAAEVERQFSNGEAKGE